MLRVRQDLCIGCGFCAAHCPQQAISLLTGQAEIDNGRCNECCICLELCPRGAIIEAIAVSVQKLKASVKSMMETTDELIERIERLKQHS